MISESTTDTQLEIPWLRKMEESDDQPVDIDPDYIFLLEEMEHK